MKYERLELEAFLPKQKLRMLQNAVEDVTELAYVKQIGDQDIARGNLPLTYHSFMELLLSACSTYDKKITLPGKQKHAVYATEAYGDDDGYPSGYPSNGEYEVFNVDTDIDHITAFATGTRRFGSKPASGHPKSKFLPREEWNKMTQEEKDKFIAKRRQEWMSSHGITSKTLQSLRQANVHEVEDVINIDDIVDYFDMQHDVTSQDDVADVKGDEALSNDALLAYMAGRNTGASPPRPCIQPNLYFQ
jgi:hypothetical protein